MDDSSSSEETASPAAPTTSENSTASEYAESSGSPAPERVKPEPESSNEEEEEDLKSLPPSEKKIRRYRPHLAGYRELLNSAIEEVCSPQPSDDEDGHLPDSQIGVSFWTSDEKEAFFSALAFRGPGDLPALAKAVGTKSIPEIQTYLHLLEAGVVEASATLQLDQGLDISTVPAALEISAECEGALEAAGDALGRLVEKREYDSLKARLGDEWLIDQTVARKLDDEFEEEQNDDEEDAEADPSDDESPWGAFFCKDSEQRAGTDPPPSARLLRPSEFLSLSENVFMNGQPDTGANWRKFLPGDGSLDGPAMVHTAFDDFYNLTISLTRRLVQASLFQAMTRLRASDASRPDWRPHADVIALDVRAATDILGVQSNSKSFWAKTARKCDVNVYTDSKGYKDGRVGTRVGVQLTHDEVEAELGLSMPPPENAKKLEEDMETESDDYTIESIDEVDNTQPDNVISSELESEGEEDEAKTIHASNSDKDSSASMSPRRSPELSENDYVQAEATYLDALDRQASRFEEQNLWEMLHLVPTQFEDAGDDNELPKPPIAPKVIRDSESTPNWRHRVQYRSEWEVHDAPVEEDEFVAMDQSGHRGRKRRRSRSAS